MEDGSEKRLEAEPNEAIVIVQARGGEFLNQGGDCVKRKEWQDLETDKDMLLEWEWGTKDNTKETSDLSHQENAVP